MTENDIFVKHEEEAILSTGVPKKKTKKAMSAERKQQLLEQLKRGRETARLNRQKKKEVKPKDEEELINAETKTEVEKVDKLQEVKEIVKDNKNKSSYELKNDLDLLRKELSEIKSLLTKKEEKQIEKIIEKQEKQIEKTELKEHSAPVDVPKPKPQPVTPQQPPKPLGLRISRFNNNFFGGF